MKYAAPSSPRSLEETGQSKSALIGLVAKVMNDGGTMVANEISEIIKLPRALVRLILKEMGALHLIESQGLDSPDIRSDVRYVLTDKGLKLAVEATLNSHYVGPTPVPLTDFWAQVEKQSIQKELIQKDALDKALSDLVLPDILVPQLGPAANSGRSILLYGDSGNGKTSIAQAIGQAFNDEIYVPFAISIGSQIIVFFDETVHEIVEDDDTGRDERWVLVKRPTITTGGELTLEMLDLQFDPRARVYEAPTHVKALGGVFIIDDFGRQRPTPLEILNRWIVPLESGYDILSLHIGRKFRVPFDQLVIFSTNIHPRNLGDEATMRRIYFKIFVPSPTKGDFEKIFENECKRQGIAFTPDTVNAFFESHYGEGSIAPSGAHPGFLLAHIKAASAFLGREPVLSTEMLDLAWKNVAILGDTEKITDLSDVSSSH